MHRTTSEGCTCPIQTDTRLLDFNSNATLWRSLTHRLPGVHLDGSISGGATRGAAAGRGLAADADAACGTATPRDIITAAAAIAAPSTPKTTASAVPPRFFASGTRPTGAAAAIGS